MANPQDQKPITTNSLKNGDSQALRHRFLRRVFLRRGLLLGIGALTVTTLVTFENASAGQVEITLKNRLLKGLKVFKKEDKAFIQLVVSKVDSKELPQKLVDSTFLWARKKAKNSPKKYHKRQPMIYFKPALIARARKIKIILD